MTFQPPPPFPPPVPTKKPNQWLKPVLAGLAGALAAALVGVFLWLFMSPNEAGKAFDEVADDLASSLQTAAKTSMELHAQLDDVYTQTADGLDIPAADLQDAKSALKELDSAIEKQAQSPYLAVTRDASIDERIMSVRADVAAVPQKEKTQRLTESLGENAARLDNLAETATTKVAVVAEQATVAAPAEPAPSEEEAVPQEDEWVCNPPVPGAYRCAGGPVPAEAQKLQNLETGRTSAETPSGNIVCAMHPTTGSPEAGHIRCTVFSWPESMLGPEVPEEDKVGRVQVEMYVDSGPPFLAPSSTRPYGPGTSLPTPQVLQYGQVYYWDDLVLASSEEGLTFWSTKTGYGAFVNKDGFYPF